jgi:hypothetical protein
MQAVLDALERVPVATITHVFVAVILGVDLIVQGSLSSDALTYAGIVEGGNVGVGAARAHVAATKVRASHPKLPSAATAARVVRENAPEHGTSLDVAPVEPGDPDGLSHVSTTNPGQVPPDQGDAGGTT